MAISRFHVGGSDLGIAFDEVHLDNSLASCACLCYIGDSIEFGPTEVKENTISKDIPVLTGIKTNSRTSDTITIKWDPIEGTSFYRIEVEGLKSWEGTLLTKYSINGLEPMTKYNIRMYALKGASFGYWREYVAEFTQKPYKNNWSWMDCPSDTIWYYRYDVSEENPMIATIIGNSLIPPGKNVIVGRQSNGLKRQ